MKLSNDQLRQNAAAMLAFADGKPIEYQPLEFSTQPWLEAKTPNWSFKDVIYRPKPEPVTRPWVFEEAPLALKVANRDDSKTPATAYLNPTGYTVHWGPEDDWEDHTFASILSDFTQLDGTPCGITQ